MTPTIDMGAEVAERDRIRALDESGIDLRLKAQGLDPTELFLALDALLGCEAGTVAAAPALCSAPETVSPAADEVAAAADKHPPEAFEVSGRVKFFDSLKRFGFIVPDDGRSDVLLHVSCLRASGHETAHVGARIQVLVYNGPKGLQAVRVLGMDDSTAVHPSQLVQRTHAKVEAESDWEEMTVRWYNLQRGFGFVHRGEGSQDVFVHAETLRRWGVGALRPGQTVEVRWGTTGKGRMAAEIRPARGEAMH
jgi:cold shock protein